MSGIEDSLRQVMADHDQEAPAAADLLGALKATSGPARRRRTRRPRVRWYVPLAAAGAVVAVLAGSLWVGRLVDAGRQAHRGTGAQLSCPARYAGLAPWVPARPAGVDGRARLVPRTTPSSAVVCAYAGRNTDRQQAGWVLSGRRPLASGLAALAAQLSWQPSGAPRACTLVGGKQTNYLIGLTYPGGGRIWVTATHDPNDCVASSNGEFSSSGVLGPIVTTAFTSGRWPARQPAGCNRPGLDTGRLGQNAVMVPEGSTSLIICTPAARTVSSGYRALISALNSLPARPSTHSCDNGPGSAAPSYQLLFSYPQGPPVQVIILGGCRPAIDNGSLQSPSARTIVSIIRHLLTTT